MNCVRSVSEAIKFYYEVNFLTLLDDTQGMLSSKTLIKSVFKLTSLIMIISLI